MNKYFLLIIPILLAGCTELDSAINNFDENYVHGQDYDYGSFTPDESRIFSSLTDLPFLESATPAPGSNGFPVNGFLYFYFNEWGGYSGFSWALYERETLMQVSLDTSTFDSFDGKDLGLIPFDSLGINALKPYTAYLLSITNVSDNTAYYFEFTTGEADEIKPAVEYARFQNNDLEIAFSETIKSWTLKESGNLELTKDGTPLSADFDNLRTSGSYFGQNSLYYIEYPSLTPGTYILTVKNVKDSSGNILDDYETTIVKE